MSAVKNKNLNYETQFYKGIPLNLINRNYSDALAKRFTINNTNQNVWIPNMYLEADGTLVPGKNLDFVFDDESKLKKAGLEKNENNTYSPRKNNHLSPLELSMKIQELVDEYNKREFGSVRLKIIREDVR